MVEVSRKFPTPEMLDRLAKALEVETYQLFDASATPDRTPSKIFKHTFLRVARGFAPTPWE